MNWYIEVLKKYAVFSGRSRRKEYWYFLLFHLVIFFVLAFVDVQLGWFDPENNFGLLTAIYGLGVLLPALAVSVRRFHDLDRTGWWVLVCLIPFVGGIVFLVFMALPGTSGENQYGPDPIGAAV